MNETKMDWDDLRLFLAIARSGGLAAAAEATGKSPPTLGRRMVALEALLGVEVFHRHARGYDLTEDGQALLTKALALEGQITPLVPDTRTTLVKISAGTWMTQALCDRAAEIIRHDSDITLRFISADHVLDIAHREAVIGIRNQRPDQIGLACRRVGKVHFAGYGLDDTPRPWAKPLGNTPSARWLAENTSQSNRIEITTPRNALDLALGGVANVILPSFIGDAQPRLRRVTPIITALDHDQWLVSHNEDRFQPEVRRTINRIHSVLKALHG